MNTSSIVTARFEVRSVLRKAKGIWVANELRLFGYLAFGSLSLGETVRIPIRGGNYIETMTARFQEDLTDEWLGLPFYNRVEADHCPFCVCVEGTALKDCIVAIPSLVTAHFEHRRGLAIRE